VAFAIGTRGIELVAISTVESRLTDRRAAPKQGDEGAPDAWVLFTADVAEGLDGIAVGDELLVLTWLDAPAATCFGCIRAATSRGRGRACSAPARRTARTRSACIA
jgi:tRNA (Thr-GGU) A37 N-methylase